MAKYLSIAALTRRRAPTIISAVVLLLLTAVLVPAASAAAAALPGIDVNSHSGGVNWGRVAGRVQFVYIKATEGTYYHNPDFTSQYNGPYSRKVLRGAYHFAIPNNSSGAAQANYFVKHGGGWSSDGRTLPGALDAEYDPYGRPCYGLSQARMRAWIWGFVIQYKRDTGIWPVLYTSTLWWRRCTGNARGFQKYDPLWIACYCSGAGPLPAGYKFYTFWQYADAGRLPGDQDRFNGSARQLRKIALDSKP